MVWDEGMIKYAHRKICDKYRPWNCERCPLGHWNGCNIGIMINELKEWSETNISKKILLAESERYKKQVESKSKKKEKR